MKTVSFSRVLRLSLLLVLTCCAPSAQAAFVSLFDGKTFKGWEGDTAKTWRIEKGTLVAGSLEKKEPRNEFLSTTRRFDHFELRLKFKITGNININAGVQFRTERIPNHHEVIGYQADIGQGVDGHLYDESRRRRMLATPDKDVLKKAQAAVAADGWETYRIRAVGNRVQLWRNGIQTIDYTEKEPNIPQTGIIAIQIHGGMQGLIAYKDIEIQELTKDGKPKPTRKAEASTVRHTAVDRFGTTPPSKDPVQGLPGFPDRKFALAKDDVVVFTGQTDMVRSRQDGTLEALLAYQYAEARPQFRNMAWEGDTVYEQWRDLNFGSWVDQFNGVGATVVLAQYGQMEALEGLDRLDDFTAAYNRLLDQYEKRTRRIVLISPRPFEKPLSPHTPDHRDKNRVIRQYTKAIEAMAERRGFVFVDLSRSSLGLKKNA